MLIEIDDRDDVCILRLHGRLLAGTDPKYLSDKADEIKRRNSNQVMVDLRDLVTIGSAGIGFLVALYTSVTKNPSGRFVLAGATLRVREVLELTRLSTIIPMRADIDSAMAFLREESSAARS